MAPVAMEAALKCLMCGETRHWIGRVDLILGPHPFFPGVWIERPAVALDKKKVNQWSSSHLGPIIISHFHMLA